MLFDLLSDALLVTGFGLQHSILATLFVKRWAKTTLGLDGLSWRTVTSSCNIAYILAAAPLWRSVPVNVWQLEGATGVVVASIGVLGWLWYFQIHLWEYDVGQAFGSTPFIYWLRGIPAPPAEQWKTGMRRWIAFPVHTAFFPMFFAVPTMTLSGLILALTANLYNVVGTVFYDRRLRTLAGPVYGQYREKTGLLLPRWSAPEGAKELKLPGPAHLKPLQRYWPAFLLGILFGSFFALVLRDVAANLPDILRAWLIVALASVLGGVAVRVLTSATIAGYARLGAELQSFLSTSAAFLSAIALLVWIMLHFLRTGLVPSLFPILPFWVTILWLVHFTTAQLTLFDFTWAPGPRWRTATDTGGVGRAGMAMPARQPPSSMSFEPAPAALQPQTSTASDKSGRFSGWKLAGRMSAWTPQVAEVDGGKEVRLECVPKRFQPIAANLIELAVLADSVRALQSSDGSFISEPAAKTLLDASAAQLRRIADHVTAPERQMFGFYEKALLGDRGKLRQAARTRANLLNDDTADELTLLCSPLRTWHGKSKTLWHAVVASFKHDRWNAFIKPMAESIAQTRDELAEVLQLPELTVLGLPYFRIDTRFVCGGEAAIPPTHFAYFLPYDEGVAARDNEGTIVYQDAYLARFYRRSRVIGAEVLAPNLKTGRSAAEVLELLLLWFRGHDIGHYFRLPATDFKRLRRELPGGHNTSMVLQEVMADVLGFLMIADGSLRHAYGVSQDAAAEIFLAEMLQYLHRGPDAFIDSRAALMEFRFLLAHGYLRLASDRRQIEWDAAKLYTGMTELAKLVVRGVLAADLKQLRSLVACEGDSRNNRLACTFVRQLQNTFIMAV